MFLSKLTQKIFFIVFTLSLISGCSDNDSNKQNNSQANDIAFEGYSYKSHFVELENSLQMHYLDEGEGDPILLIHGIPTSSYLWRDVIPSLTDHGRVIAIDLMNFGKSSKVNRYSLKDHAAFIEEFVESLELENIRLVLHDYGGPVGLTYARDNAEKVSGVALFETAFAPFPSIETVPPGAPVLKMLQENGHELATETDFWVGTTLGNNQFNNGPELSFDEKFVLKNLNEVEFQEYLSPFQTSEDKEVLFQFAFTIAFLDQPGPLLDEWFGFSNYIAQAAIPKLVIFANPGLIPSDIAPINQQTGLPFTDPTNGNLLSLRNIVEGNVISDVGGWIVPAEVKDLETVTKHFIQEDAPEELGLLLSEWFEENF